MAWPPICTGMVAGSPVRFFSAPGDVPAFPCHAVDDLQLAMRVPRILRRELKAGLGKSEWRADIKVAVSDGQRVLIGPHYMGQGLVGAAIEVGRVPASTEAEYAGAVRMAFDKECAEAGLTSRQTFDRAMAIATGGQLASIPRLSDPVTGATFISSADVQKSLKLTDSEIGRFLDDLRVRGELSEPLDTSKLVRQH